MIVISQMTRVDLERALELEALCFSVPWTSSMFISELTNPDCCYFAAFEDGIMLGYAGMSHVLDEGYVNNVAVDPAFRRRGIAKSLMKALCDRAKTLNLSFLSLEVRESNAPAIALYSCLGFEPAGKRRGYYDKPREDALIMTLFL